MGSIRRLFRLGIRTRHLRAREVDDELAAHFALRAEQLSHRGVAGDDALEEAYRRFGPVDDGRARLLGAATERDTYMQREEHMDAFRQDLAYAIRQLRRSPGFALATIVTLALGIGANATMFGVIDHLLLRSPAHVTAPERLAIVSLTVNTGKGTHNQQILSYPIYLDLLATPNAFEDVAAYSSTSMALGIGPQSMLLQGSRVTDGYFRTLGVRPLIGRFFLPEEAQDAPGANVAVLSYGLWQRRFAGDRAIIGRPVDLGGQQFTVVGVAPEDFTGVDPSEVDVWVPMLTGISPASLANLERNRQSYRMHLVARLHSGVSFAGAAAAATTKVRASDAASGTGDAELRRRSPRIELVSAVPSEARRNEAPTRVALLLGAVSLLVLVLTCANITNLQLARAIRRRREIVIRLALGVSRTRLFTQLAIDAILLAVVGGAAALIVVAWGGAVARRLLTADVRWVGSPVDGRVLAYTAAIALVAGIVTGMLPAINASRAELTSALKTGARDGGSGGGKARFILLAIQTALTVILLVGTGLFVLSFRRINAVPLGMQPGKVITAMVNFGSKQPSDEELTSTYNAMKDVAMRVNGVTHAAVGMSMPFMSSSALYIGLPGRDSVPVTSAGGPYFNAVGPGYFAVMGTHVIAGRDFTDADRRGTAPVAIVNATTAKLWWPGESAVGKCIHIDADSTPCSQIVGVIENARRQKILEEETVQVYSPTGQGPSWGAPRALFVRVNGDPNRVATVLQRELQRSLPALPYIETRPMTDVINPQMRSWRLGSGMFGAFAVLAIVLATVGLYGMLSYDVAQRAPEFGVRMALGATDGRIVQLIVSRAFGVMMVGGGVGFATALAAGVLVAPLLFQTSAREPSVYLFVVAVMGSIVLVATALPALRAARVQPSSALRSE